MAATGRPKITLEDLPSDWQNVTLELMSEGASQTEVMAALGVSRETFYRLLDEEEEFSNAIKKGLLLSQAWWEKQGRKNLITGQGVSFNSTLWFMNMKNRFKEDWRDKQELEHSGEIKSELSEEERIKRIAQILETARARGAG